MLLRLAPMEAALRASFAVASVAAAAVGHALGAAHVHHDMPRILAAGLLLLGVVWATRRPGRILGAALAAQLLVHGGIPTAGHMALSHAVATLLALLLLTQGERLWALLGNLCLGRLPADPVAVPRPSTAPLRHGVRTACSALLRSSAALRAPPVPA